MLFTAKFGIEPKRMRMEETEQNWKWSWASRILHCPLHWKTIDKTISNELVFATRDYCGCIEAHKNINGIASRMKYETNNCNWHTISMVIASFFFVLFYLNLQFYCFVSIGNQRKYWASPLHRLHDFECHSNSPHIENKGEGEVLHLNEGVDIPTRTIRRFSFRWLWQQTALVSFQLQDDVNVQLVGIYYGAWTASNCNGDEKSKLLFCNNFSMKCVAAHHCVSPLLFAFQLNRFGTTTAANHNEKFKVESFRTIFPPFHRLPSMFAFNDENFRNQTMNMAFAECSLHSSPHGIIGERKKWEKLISMSSSIASSLAQQ